MTLGYRVHFCLHRFLLLSVFVFSSITFAAEKTSPELVVKRRLVTTSDQLVCLQAHADIFHAYLKQIPDVIRAPIPDVFLAYSKDNAEHIEKTKKLYHELTLAGIPSDPIYFEARPGKGDVFEHMDKVLTAKKVIVIGSPELKKEYESGNGLTAVAIKNLRTRWMGGGDGIIPVWFDGNFADCFPVGLHSLPPQDLSADYHVAFFDLLINLYQAEPLSHPIRGLKEEFIRLRGIPLDEGLEDYGVRLLKSHEEQRAGDIAKLKVILETAQREREAVSIERAKASSSTAVITGLSIR
jgi:hypothetical protein